MELDTLPQARVGGAAKDQAPVGLALEVLQRGQAGAEGQVAVRVDEPREDRAAGKIRAADRFGRVLRERLDSPDLLNRSCLSATKPFSSAGCPVPSTMRSAHTMRSALASAAIGSPVRAAS